jgi:radical SAM protein with 4Fe4S-binding SPASM domain
MDWNHKNIVGNISENSIVDIWNNSKMQDFRINHLKLNRQKYETCGNCGELKYAQRDNIDEFRSELLKRFEEYER